MFERNIEHEVKRTFDIGDDLVALLKRAQDPLDYLPETVSTQTPQWLEP